MQVDIQVRQLPPSRSLKVYTQRRIRFALTRFEERIQRVSMWLSDVNGPKGGKDKHCRLHVALAGNTSIVIEDIHENLYVAINRAIDRAGQSLVRKLDRQQSRLQRSRTVMFDSSVTA
jgi:putative sigma-54 modulation protein